jgi:hypothetical protein
VATVNDSRSPPTVHPIADPDRRAGAQWVGFFGWVARLLGGLYVAATVNPGSLAAGARAATTVTVTGAARGQWARATFDQISAEITLSAEVTAADTVTVTFFNATGAGAVDLPSGTLRVRVGSMT